MKIPFLAGFEYNINLCAIHITMVLNIVIKYDMSQWQHVYSHMYIQNKSRPWPEPWGTPQVRGPTEEEPSMATTEKVLFGKADSSKSRAVFWMPTHFSFVVFCVYPHPLVS